MTARDQQGLTQRQKQTLMLIAHWKPEQVRNLLIPILPMEIQKEIADLVRKSHEARKESKELLEEAKRKVEEMIEKGNSN